MEYQEIDLSGILLGSATAATQIEGGDTNNSWYDFACRGKIKDGTSPLRACDHINRYKEDVALMKEMGLKVYRFGLEWSRLEPSEGCFDSGALEFYRELIVELLNAGIKPLVTLHHFTNPTWFESMGAFTNKASAGIFLRFVKFAVDGLKDLVTEYITINEPNVYATMGYYFGEWPPEQKSFSKVLKVFANMARGHILAYQYIHASIPNALVGIAQHLRVFDPLNPKSALDRLGARSFKYLFNDLVTDAMAYGRARFPMPRLGLPKGKYFDFLGINYYSREMMKGFKTTTKEGAKVNDLGWEIYPEGLKRLCLDYYAKYKMPIFITENGTCDNNDTFREEFIYTHLRALADAKKEGADIRRYYHWTLMDNFEWLEGESARFGLIHTDFNTGKRTPKASSALYAHLAKKQ